MATTHLVAQEVLQLSEVVPEAKDARVPQVSPYRVRLHHQLQAAQVILVAGADQNQLDLGADRRVTHVPMHVHLRFPTRKPQEDGRSSY